jgi:photosystem II stability/assembly factor-like uncharacterized protein
MKLFRTLPALLVAAVAAAAAAPDARWRDVLDTPAAKSALAARVLVNGLARAGDRLIAVGQRGHVLTSDDGGRAWQQADVPVSSDLVAVSFPDPSNGWAVGHDGVVLHSGDGGRTWTRQLDGRSAQALMGPQGAESPLLDVWFRDPSNGYVVGAFGLALRTRDGGRSWEPLRAIDNPKGLHLYAVRGIGPDVFVVGEQGIAFKLDAEGERSTTLELPYKGTLFGIVGNERALVVHGLRGTALRSTDGGMNWQPVQTGLQVGLTAGTVTAAGRIVLASQSGHVLTSDDDGKTFAAAATPSPLPAAAVVEGSRGALVVGGPRGVQPLALP